MTAAIGCGPPRVSIFRIPLQHHPPGPSCQRRGRASEFDGLGNPGAGSPDGVKLRGQTANVQGICQQLSRINATKTYSLLETSESRIAHPLTRPELL